MRAISLFSGGLDSMLSVKLLTTQGVKVTAIFIDVGFGSKDDKSELLKKRANMVGADFEIINAKDGFIQDILFDPKYGYGKNFNPCIDCHANMIRIAKALLPKYNAKFIITGEVVGQRPMSQRAEAIKNVNKLANESDDGIILRPMSAKIMTPTIPEIKGWVDREKLLGVQGRSREIQLKLAKEYGFEEFESPGGGCLLTDPMFSHKMKEMIEYKKFIVEDIDILKAGRHFRLLDGAKLVVGRNKEDNDRIEKINHSEYDFIKLDGIMGPLSLLSSDASSKDRELALKIVLSYTKAEFGSIYKIKIEEEIFSATPLKSKNKAREYLVTILS